VELDDFCARTEHAVPAMQGQRRRSRVTQPVSSFCQRRALSNDVAQQRGLPALKVLFMSCMTELRFTCGRGRA
jgi:hypothetical protein